jgi:hypothetical protein
MTQRLRVAPSEFRRGASAKRLLPVGGATGASLEPQATSPASPLKTSSTPQAAQSANNPAPNERRLPAHRLLPAHKGQNMAVQSTPIPVYRRALALFLGRAHTLAKPPGRARERISAGAFTTPAFSLLESRAVQRQKNGHSTNLSCAYCTDGILGTSRHSLLQNAGKRPHLRFMSSSIAPAMVFAPSRVPFVVCYQPLTSRG